MKMPLSVLVNASIDVMLFLLVTALAFVFVIVSLPTGFINLPFYIHLCDQTVNFIRGYSLKIEHKYRKYK